MDPSASLSGTVFCLSGTFSVTRAVMENRIKALGGEVAKSMTKKVNALLVADPDNVTAKVQEAVASGMPLLNEAFLQECETLATQPAAAKKGAKDAKGAKGAKATKAAAAKPAPAAKATRGKKKAQPAVEQEEEEEQQEPAEAKPAAKGKNAKKAAASSVAVEEKPATKSKRNAKKKPMYVEEEEEEEEEDEPVATTTTTASSSSSGTTLDSAGFFGRAPKVQTWKNNVGGQPYFPSQYNVLKNVVLQNTEIMSNKNKYYALELHEADGKYFRLFTHYGRTDDLQSRGPMAGQRENRYYHSLADAQAAFGDIYRQKTSARKGYREVSLASSNIGSDKARGKSAGEIGEGTLAKTKRPAEEEKKQETEAAATTKKGRATKRRKKGEQEEEAQAETAAESKQEDITLHDQVRELIRYIYDEAKTKLTTSINAEVTAEGIKTPLGILSVEQVEQGEAILEQIQKEVMRASPRHNMLERLSSDFYSTIPHRLGRTKADLQAAIIREERTVKEKQELLQLMKDMLEVNSNAKSNVIFHDDTVSRYRALQVDISYVSPDSDEYHQVSVSVEESVRKSHNTRPVKLHNVFKVVRPNEQDRFRHDIGNIQMLFHGSRLSNWVGLLSRGILMPKVVVAEGGRRTDAGWLGNGIYFGHADVARNYAAPGRKGTSLVFCNSVAVGRAKPFTAITYGINEAPKGFDSCHGVMGSQFADHEYCVYDDAQQKVEYLLEVQPERGYY